MVLAIGAFLILVDVAVPYLFLRDTASFMGSFFLWTLLPALGIIAAAVYTRPWSSR